MFFATGDGKESEPSTSSIQPSQPCHHFEYPEILKATKNFDESLVIGSGGFGKVYKANIFIGASLVVAAIKRLDSMSIQGAPEFWAEVKMFSMLRHCNLVSLIGYCNYEKEMILVYEYMTNGALDDHLHNFSTPLSWLQRLNICIGAGRGLHYLHTGTGIQSGVIHRDVKSSNILLHESWAAKISDFGLSKVSPTNQPSTYVNTLIKGTFGYLDPNYFATGRLTRKSDVYAFGVVLLEVLCRKRAVDRSLDEEQWSLAAWAQDSIKEGNIKRIIDSDVKGEISPKCLKDYVRIVERCLHNTPKQRPTMAEVVVSLESILALQEKFLKPARRTMFGRMLDMLSFHSIQENSRFSATEPLRDPYYIPVYPPSKEFDARNREEEATRWKDEVEGRMPKFVRISLGELKAQSKAQGLLTMREYNPREENGIAKKRFAYYNSDILKDYVVGTNLRMIPSHMDHALKIPVTNVHRVRESTKLNNVHIKDTMGHRKKTNTVYSRPLMPPDGSIEDMLKDTKDKLKQQLGKHMQPWPKVVRHKT